MKILLYGINYAPELTGIGKYSGELAEWLVARGHEVRVVTAPPYYPQWVVREGYFAYKYSVEEVNGVKVYRAPVWVPHQPSGAKRLFHLLSFAAASFPIILLQLFWRPEVVLNVEPPLICAPAGLILGRFSKSFNWLHIQDYEVDAAFALGLLGSAKLRNFVLAVERKLMSRFDWVTSISEAMTRKAADKGVEPGKLGLAYNWVDISDINPQSCNTQFRRDLNIAGSDVVALYSGNMGNKQGLELLSDTARLLQERKDIKFIFCGGGSGRAELELGCDGLNNVQFLPLQPAHRLNELLATADIHLLPQRADAADLVMPSKLLGMLASGRPVVATAGRETELGAVVAECGIVVPPGDSKAFARALEHLAGDEALRKHFGKVGRVLAVTRFSKQSVLENLESDLIARTKHVARESDGATKSGTS